MVTRRGAFAALVGIVVVLIWVFRPGRRPKPEAAAPVERGAPRTQIVVQWPQSEVGFFALWWIDSRLSGVANGLFEVDGNDIGSGTVNFFLYAPDAKVDAAVRRVVELREEGRLPPHMSIGVAQYTNEERTDWTRKPVYPPGLPRFDLM